MVPSFGQLSRSWSGRVGIVVGAGVLGLGVGAFAAAAVGLVKAVVSRPVLVSKAMEMGAKRVVVVPASTKGDDGQVREVEEGGSDGDVKILGVLFDMDGTLVETFGIWATLLDACAKEMGYKDGVDREAYRGVFGQPMEKNVEVFMPGADVSAVTAYCNAHYGEYLDQLQVLDGALEAVDAAVALFGSRVGLVTNCPAAITQLILQAAKLESTFSVVACSGAEAVPATQMLSPRASGARKLRGKPHTDMLDYAAAQLGLDTSECLMVGDTRYDMLAGEAAGCVTVAVEPSPLAHVQLAGIEEFGAWLRHRPRTAGE
ncbi:phosphoglycolate phosphatase [Thecamonas trahens ATCC 50062]|uniref:Phosphoglycolate phosphatase n=1 Tax=Thecamonas trahens ATCC 50062 TaxID=461836 RepID=A0A0L0DSY6_THETB|nr:phosphoglycolate phosphatase [Thecamonas trahens ATCC 50062]KNC55126.1 phosphoglycolate phosphatase [Thecamonas trahens ATCC 50062]|eukprot:XP_013753306.1 phosphoglycolate phosphatase [Thecamonas trahens ATCC 50062]